MRLIEFIESYRKTDNGDYQWNDNHGELIRCKDCEHYILGMCEWFGYGQSLTENDFCSRAKRKEKCK